ncbi:mannosyltransferase [Hysterangium stoloniferum]|nr:mannosyltransferase [Hysterangium stoloniferum]
MATWYFYQKRHLKATSTAKRQIVLKSLGIHGASATDKRFIGFFHPYCNAGGGGERVLWTAVAFVQRTEPHAISVIYSGDKGVTKHDIIDKVKARFDIALDPRTLHFVFLEYRNLVEDSTWPRFTLIGQSIGSMYLGWEAMSKFTPDIFIDTMGYAFTFYLIRPLVGIPIGAYVHYPVITMEMMRRVRSRQAWHTNSNTVSSSWVLSKGKQIYYNIFMFYYSRALFNASFIMVNSTWTKEHLDAVLEYGMQDSWVKTLHLGLCKTFFLLSFGEADDVSRPTTRIVYPPCDTKRMSTFPLAGRHRVIMSLAQFRPEKDHAAQLHSLNELFRIHPEYRRGDLAVKLILIGSSRNADDATRIQNLQDLANELGIEANVEFKVNVPYPVLLENLSQASIGLSTMVDEHFGINVVEFMAAGLIPVVHASAGPLKDIVVPRDGYHCTTPETFAQKLHAVLSLSPEQDLAMRERARAHATEVFSEKEFELGWYCGGWKEWREKLR